MEGYYDEGRAMKESTRLLQERFVELCESYGYRADKIPYSDIAYGVRDEGGGILCLL
jgi:hypothetical protein